MGVKMGEISTKMAIPGVKFIHKGQVKENKGIRKTDCGRKRSYSDCRQDLSIGLSTSYPHFGDKWRKCSQNVVRCGKYKQGRGHAAVD